MNRIDQSAGWPVHPQPLDGESLTSWLMRQADANCTPLRTFLRTYLGEGEWRRKDLDLLSDTTIGLFAQLGRVEGGIQRLRMASLSPWKGPILAVDEAARNSWISSLSAVRYCPACLATDSVPHLRLIWRLHFLPLCPKHSQLLWNRCWSCSRPQRINQFLMAEHPARCESCGHSLSEAPPIQPRDCYVLAELNSVAANLFGNRHVPAVFRWTHTTPEFFNVLRFLMRLVNLSLWYGGGRDKLFESHGLPLSPQYDWRKNESVSCVLLERSLRLMRNWPMNIRGFLAENQSNFNEISSEYGDNLPEPLRRFRTKPQGNRRVSDVVKIGHVVGTSREVLVKKAVNELVDSNRWVAPVTVSRMTGIDYRTLMKHESLCSIIIEGRRILLRQRESQISSALASMKTVRLRPSVRSVAAYIGKSTCYVKSSPNAVRLIVSRS